MARYEPAPWTPVDSIAILRRWWWYLTGRLHVLWIPEVIRATLGDDLANAYYTPDAPVGTIVPPGWYEPEPRWPGLLAKNWIAGPEATSPASAATTGRSVPRNRRAAPRFLLPDPHVYFTLPMDWYEYRLLGAGYDVYGLGLPRSAGLLFGRNKQVAWGVTNNICLQPISTKKRSIPTIRTSTGTATPGARSKPASMKSSSRGWERLNM
ncbi:MAG: penicillin acylase family protein [Thermomicrobiales bacterium]